MPKLRLFAASGSHVPLVFVSLVTLSAILRMPGIGFVILAVVPFTRNFALLPGRLTGRLLTALFVLRVRKGAHIDVLRLLRRLLEQTIDSHDRRRHFAIQTAVDIDQIVWLYVLFVKRGDRDNNGDDAAFITKLITVISLPLEQIAAQRNGRAIVHGFRLLNGHDPAILDAAIAVIEFVRRRRRGILAKPSLIVRLRDTYGKQTCHG